MEIIKRLQPAGSIENSFIYYRLIKETLLYCLTITKSLERQTPFLPNLVHLDLARFFCLLPRHSEKSIIWFIRRTKDNRRSLSRLGTFAQPLCSPKPLLLLHSLSYSTLKLTSLPCGKSTFTQVESKLNVF